MKPERFYDRENGLCFTCQAGCAACCKISGKVEISDQDVVRMAQHIGVEEHVFRQKYTRGNKKSLELEELETGPCVMLDANDRCSVYEVRPLQCRTYPFWDEVIANDFTWLLERDFCPGIDKGQRFSPEEIDNIRMGKNDVNGYEID